MDESNKKFIIHILSYLGVALIGGSIVHIGTLDGSSIRYFILGSIGVALMITGNVLEARMNNEPLNIKYFGIVTALAIATGFLSGGVQHYLDNPGYAASLLGIGLVVSYVAFAQKYHTKITSKGTMTVVVLALSIILVSNTFLHETIPHGTEAEHH